ncbi:RQC domain-containing protein, partial [Methylocucumis oryzae]
GSVYGATHLIDVLLGHKTERVLKYGHDHVSTFFFWYWYGV